MSVTGKGFEEIFNTLATKEGVDVVRFYDTLYQYKDVNNSCDFVISLDKDLPALLVETKVCQSSSISIDSKIKQLDRLLSLKKFRSFVVVWFVKYKKVLAFEPEQIDQLRKRGIKSINPSKLENINIEYIELASVLNFNRTNPKKLEVKRLWQKK